MVRFRCALCAALGISLFLASSAPAGQMFINEFNAVDPGEYLQASPYSAATTEQDTYFAQQMRALTADPSQDGRIQGNGGNWVELVVAVDHTNIQGWQLKWVSMDKSKGHADQSNGTNIWTGDGRYEQGIVSFSPTAPIWSDLRKGTIITVCQVKDIDVDTTWTAGGRNFTNNLAAGAADVTINMRTDTSYNPTPWNPPAGDWTINVSAKYEQDLYAADGAYDRLVSTVTNVKGDGPGNFSVGPDKWQMTICNAAGAVIAPAVGEDITGWGGGGISANEIGRLDVEPSPSVTIDQYKDSTKSTFGQPNWLGSGYQDFDAFRVPEPATMALLAIGLPLALRRRNGRGPRRA